MNIMQKNRREYRRLKKSNRERVAVFFGGPIPGHLRRYIRSRVTAVAFA